MAISQKDNPTTPMVSFPLNNTNGQITQQKNPNQQHKWKPSPINGKAIQ